MANFPPNNILPFILNAVPTPSDLIDHYQMMSYQHFLAAQQLIHALNPNVATSNALMTMPLGNQMTIGSAMFRINVGIPELPTTSSTIPDLNVPNTSAPPSTLPILKSENVDVDLDLTFSNIAVLDDVKFEKPLLLNHPRNFTVAQLESLQKFFAKNRYPSTKECEIVRTEIGLTPVQIRNWCNKQRQILKKNNSHDQPGNKSWALSPSILSSNDNAVPNVMASFGSVLERQPPIQKSRSCPKFTKFQSEILKKYFSNDPFPGCDQRKVIAEKTGLTDRQITVWYQNRRCVLRKTERERLVKEEEKDE